MMPLQQTSRIPTAVRFLGIALLLATYPLAICPAVATAQTQTVWIGTITPSDGESKGIYRATLNEAEGTLSQPVLAAEVGSPGFVVLHPSQPLLYAVCQLPDSKQAGVACWSIAPETQNLTYVSGQPINDGGATHLAIDPAAQFVFTAQYGSGSVAMFPLSDDGSIQPRCDLVKHAGSGPNTARQQGPHPHWVGTSPDGRFLFVPDLGIDQVVVYAIDHEHQKLKPHAAGSCPPGAGPRHMKFHPNGRWVYVLNELELTITRFDYDKDQGKLTQRETVVALPEDLKDIPNTASEIRITPRGDFLYSANRGHDSISAFAINPESGKLKRIEIEAIRGAWPRNFNLTPQADWLIAAGRNSNSLTVFRRDKTTGKLSFTGQVVHCPSPICITMVPDSSTADPK